MVELRRKSLVCRDVWFDESWSPEGTDLVLFYHWSEPVDPNVCADFHSLEIDLQASDEEILRGFTGSTRNQINRATKEGLGFESWAQPSPEILNEFFAFHHEFASDRGMNAEDPAWMPEYAAQGALLLTRALDASGRVLVWHSYFRNALWVRQLQSVSHFATATDKDLRNAVSRANRYLHWMDLQECRRMGIRFFDFGGWYHGQENEKLLRVNAFKEEFGGRRTHRYHSMRATSMKGTLFLKARSVLRGKDALLHVV